LFWLLCLSLVTWLFRSRTWSVWTTSTCRLARYLAFLLPVTVVGLALVKLDALGYVIRCCNHVSDTNNNRHLEAEASLLRTRFNTGSSSDSAHSHSSQDGSTGGPDAWVRSLSGEELLASSLTDTPPGSGGIARSNSGGSNSRGQAGSSSSYEPPNARPRSGSDGSLTGVGGRLLTPKPRLVLVVLVLMLVFVLLLLLLRALLLVLLWSTRCWWCVWVLLACSGWSFAACWWLFVGFCCCTG